MKPIECWKNQQLGKFMPIRVIATTEARCNLACSHCYWSHEMQFKPISNWEPTVALLGSLKLPLFFAGRILTENGAEFLRLCIERKACSELGIVDNGFTILNFPKLIPSYTTINISIDGWRDEHDMQRGRVGAFDTAWNSVLELKRQGFDPVISSALSPLTINTWERFEALLMENDVPVSSTLVWALPNPKERAKAVFHGEQEMLIAFKKLLNGIPKLINIYSFEQIQILWPLLKELTWRMDTEVGDCLSAVMPNGTIVIYRPTSLTSVSEWSLEWDGVFYTPFTYGIKTPITMADDSYFKWVARVNTRELELWSQIF